LVRELGEFAKDDRCAFLYRKWGDIVFGLAHLACGFYLADGWIKAKHRKLLIGNSDHAVESGELLDFVFLLA
jgi:hypothetical protein